MLIPFEGHAGPTDLGYFVILFLYKHTVPTALNPHGIYRAVALTGLGVFCASVNPGLQPGLVYFAPSALERQKTRVSGNLEI